MGKGDILLRRGFGTKQIDNNFSDIDEYEWKITSITKEEVILTNPDDPEAVEEMRKKLFCKDSVGYVFCDTSTNMLFEHFKTQTADKIWTPSASVLDPYIARLVHSWNGIGVGTIMSCDGWHKSELLIHYMKLWMPERYSVIWMWLITEYVFGEKSKGEYEFDWRNLWRPGDEFEYFDRKEKSEDGNRYPREMMPVLQMTCSYTFDRNDCFKLFFKNNLYSIFLEKHKEELNCIREKWISMLLEEYSISEIDNCKNMDFLKLRGIIYNYISEDLKLLNEKWNKEKVKE
ncbi:MAG: hypothetical protein K6E47_09925 [Lachnospiraceae bacterium]|nr:hypothetical protein [Lachnospiraceae bacterium]